MRKGFTLVELSIVLILIGLLIGGILVGRTMILSSKITAVVAQIQTFDAAVGVFRSKYNDLPGDSTSFGGDGDGILDMPAGTCCDNANTVYTCELVNFWAQAFSSTQYAGMTCSGTGLPGVKAITTGTGVNTPLSKLGKPGSFFFASSVAIAASGSNNAVGTSPNYYVILDGSHIKTMADVWRIESTYDANSAVTPSELKGLDAKMDDEKANSGNIISGMVGLQTTISGVNYGGIYPNSSNNCASSASYTITNSGAVCTPLIAIGAQNSND